MRSFISHSCRRQCTLGCVVNQICLNRSRTAAADVAPLTYCFLLRRWGVSSSLRSVNPNVYLFFFFYLYAAQRLLPCHELFFLPSLKPTFHTFHGPPAQQPSHTRVLTDSVLIAKLFQRRGQHSRWHDLSAVYHLDPPVTARRRGTWCHTRRLMLLALRAVAKVLHLNGVTRRGQTKTFRPVLKVIKHWISFPPELFSNHWQP